MEAISKFTETLIPFDKKIGILYGGMSSEREVSLRSGKNCFEALKRLGYEKAELIDVDKNIAKTLQDKGIEIAYIALHGKYGEDGCIQGLLEILGIPYTGCGVRASAVAIDKDCTKRLLENAEIPVIPSIVVDKNTDIDSLKGNLKYPLMIKPVSEGSSIGMAKVENAAQLIETVKEALKYSPNVMLEEYVVGKSITVGVIENEEKTITTPILEFRTKTEWYDFEAKYTHGMTKFVLPAEISADLTRVIQDLSIDSHRAIGACGVSRVDFVVSEDGKPYVLEINTIPGMTDLSDLPAQAKEMGISYDELVKIILNSALLRK